MQSEIIKQIEEANKKALEALNSCEPHLVAVAPARDVIPGMKENMLLHAGPPVEWDRMCGPMKGAVIGALIFEGMASNEEEALRLIKNGDITFEPCHHHQAVGPMAGIISPSMQCFVVEDKNTKRRAFCNLHEGRGKILRFGAYDKEVIDRLRWMNDVLGPAINDALKLGSINLKTLMAEALHMGDECHQRFKASTSLFANRLVVPMLNSGLDKRTAKEVLDFIITREQTFLNLSMPAMKLTADSAHGIKYSTVVTTMARNGVEFGIKVSGLGEKWFTAPALVPDGLFFPGYGPQDASLDLGDSAIMETCGFGAFAMAAAPAVLSFVGGKASEAIEYTKKMYLITVGESPSYTIPILGFRGLPTGIDILKVLKMNLQPMINTGIAHKQAGIGQIGAGIAKVPIECFEKALKEYDEKYLK